MFKKYWTIFDLFRILFKNVGNSKLNSKLTNPFISERLTILSLYFQDFVCYLIARFYWKALIKQTSSKSIKILKYLLFTISHMFLKIQFSELLGISG